MGFRRFGRQLCMAVFMAFAFAIVYPDRCLDWFSDRTGRAYGLRHLVLLECLALLGLFTADLVALSLSSQIRWWLPILIVAGMGLFRFLAWLIREALGLTQR